MNNDARLADLIRQSDQGDIVLLGFPYDQGVEINGGRSGSALGPDKFRQWIQRFGTAINPEFQLDLNTINISDAGNIESGLPLEQAHKELTNKVESILKKNSIPFVLGGGNDQSFPNFCALLNHQSKKTVGVINIDAHLDVRPLKNNRAHSGSPFRLMLEDPRFSGKHLIEFASQGSQCSAEHTKFVKDHGGHIVWLSDIYKEEAVENAFRCALGKLAWDCDNIFVSFDMDSICSSDSPGVSCPSPMGLTARDAIEIALVAGSNPKVQLFDLSEYNPLIEEERTGRLAVNIFYHFCLGLASRKLTRL